MLKPDFFKRQVGRTLRMHMTTTKIGWSPAFLWVYYRQSEICFNLKISIRKCISYFLLQPCPWNLKLLYDSRKVGSNATHYLIRSSWDTWHPLLPDQTFFYFHTSIVNHFHNKILSAQGNIHITEILPSVMGGFFRGNFFCVQKTPWAC